MTSELFLAIDIGTTNTKAAIFSENGELQAISQQPFPMEKHDDHYEIDPTIWWDNTKKVVMNLPDGLKKGVVALAVTGQGPTIIPMYENGQVAHKAITWLDIRGREHVELLLRDGIDKQSAVILSKLLWLKDEIKRPVYLLQPYDYVCMKLTNKVLNMSFDIPGFRPPWYEESLMTKTRLKNHFMLPEFVPTGQEVGTILPDVADELGIPRDAKVVAGTADFAAALVGTGTIEDGNLCDRGGTSQGINLCTKKKADCDGLFITPFFIEGLWKISGVMNTTGKAIDWFCTRITHCDDSLTAISKRLEGVRRPTDLIFLPYLNGERSPHWDTSARGVFFGLDLNTDRDKLLVSIMEGVAFGIAEIIERMETSGCEIKRIRTTGGQASNPLWNQIKADVLGKEIEVPVVTESELLGTAIFAMSFVYRKSITEISKETVKIANVMYPNHEIHDRYVELFRIYKELYSKNKSLFGILKSHSSNDS